MGAGLRAIQLAGETDLAGWRAAARALRVADIPPERVRWSTGGADGLFDEAPPPPRADVVFTAPRDFFDLAADVVLNRAEHRFDLLYRLLWRLRAEPRLLQIVTDPDVADALTLQRQVRHAIHKMHAFVRFRRIDGEPETYVAWFEPPHRILEAGADYFVKRMANLRFSILSPDAAVYWDGTRLTVGPGVEGAPDEDELAACWRTYFSAVFNPARVNPRLMTQHMPRAYWRNLPEASTIPELISKAQGRTETMVHTQPSEPSRRATRIAARQARDAPSEGGVAPATLTEIAAAIQVCRRCDLWRDATQAVPGEGPTRAALMFVGEQPGDQEDLSGQPFIGPAGQLLDKALAEAGVPRSQTYVTNAVKHFKHEPRGKRRLHKTPNAGEVQACRWWLANERRLVRPKVVVALGATAAGSVLGRPVAVLRERGPAGELDDGATAFVTVHPSMLLRIPDAAAKAAAYRDFVRDLKAAWALAA